MVHPLLYVCVSTALWVMAYGYMCRAKNNLPGEWNCRILAAFHAVIMTIISYCAYRLGPNPFENPGGNTTILQELILSLSLGYFIFDLSWCLSHRSEGVVMLVHHFASIFSILYCVYYRESGTEMLAAIGGAEITNPLLQLRWFMRELGFKNNGILMSLVEYVFSVSFLFVRGVIGSYLLYRVLIHPRPAKFVKLGGFTIWIISVIFSFFILRYMWHKRIKRFFHSVQVESKDEKNQRTNNNSASPSPSPQEETTTKSK